MNLIMAKIQLLFNQLAANLSFIRQTEGEGENERVARLLICCMYALLPIEQ